MTSIHNSNNNGPNETTAIQLTPYLHEEKGIEGRASDPSKYLQSVEQRIRERQVAYETIRNLRDDVIECYRRETVNHATECRTVSRHYHTAILPRDAGQVPPPWDDKDNHLGF